MATSEFRNKNLQRPKKVGAARRQRIKVQQRRLIALGVAEDKVMKMTQPEVRKLLRHPAKLKK